MRIPNNLANLPTVTFLIESKWSISNEGLIEQIDRLIMIHAELRINILHLSEKGQIIKHLTIWRF